MHVLINEETFFFMSINFEAKGLELTENITNNRVCVMNK